MTTSSRTFLVTGATGAIGQAIARQLAMDRRHRVVLLARNEAKAQATQAAIHQASDNSNVTYELADLSRRAEIEALAGRWEGSLHCLINNAAVTPRRREETVEGIEMQWATNVLSYLWLTDALTPMLVRSAPARVVNVASYWAGDLDMADPEFKRRPYRNGTAYRQSKQANRMLTVAQAEALAPQDISVTVCHPGDVSSNLSSNLGFGGSQSPDEGARTPVWLATAPEAHNLSGQYFEERRPALCRFAADRAGIERLLQLCREY
jgi:NAD(P)-dependent dehydrogenase (short-subunit alcohol dehydrogenase family)